MNKTIKALILGLVIGMVSISSLTVFGNSITTKTTPVKVSTKAIKNKTKAIDVSLKIPVVSAGTTSRAIKTINARFYSEVMNFKNPLVKDANKFLAESKKQKDIPFHAYAAYTTYITHFNSKNLLSVAIRYYSYTGGANGLEIQRGYTTKVTDGKLLKLGDLFDKRFDYKKVISSELLRQMKAKPNNYFPEAISKFKPITADFPYYIENNNLVVFYGPFDIAPHVYGIPEFKIPFSMLKFNSNINPLP